MDYPLVSANAVKPGKTPFLNWVVQCSEAHRPLPGKSRILVDCREKIKFDEGGNLMGLSRTGWCWCWTYACVFVLSAGKQQS
jgi:hypothetical protein